MNGKKLVFIAGIFIVLIALLGYKIIYKKTVKISSPAEVHYHAGFVIFNEGMREDFSDTKYMLMKPCEVEDGHEDEKDLKEIQLDKAHLHGGMGDVLHVHVEGAKWKDLLTNLNYETDYSKVTAYLNGEKVEDIANTPIDPYDSLILFVGEVDESLLIEAVTNERIKEAEALTEDC